MTATVAAWLQPALLTALALRVAAGEADAPWLLLGALVAPLVALLRPVHRHQPPDPVVGLALALAVALLLAANFLLAADVVALLGGAPWQGVAVAGLLALLLPLSDPGRQLGGPALVLGAAALLLSLAALTAHSSLAPWTAWSQGGLRPALRFTEASTWVRDGDRFARPARLTFAEAQRVTALTAGVYRVVERDAAPPTVREWRLASGETLTLRPGDELSVSAGSRLRFEVGRRVPGAPASGIAWADAPSRGPGMLTAAVGGLVTLLGGAAAIIPAARRRGLSTAGGPLLLLAGVTAATGWGIYTAARAPDLALGGSLSAPLLRLPSLALGPRAGVPLAAVAATGIVLLLAAATISLRRRLGAGSRPAPALWAAAVGLAAALTAWPLDPWRLLMLGFGLAAAAWTPSAFAPTRLAGLAGSVAGVGVFVILAGLPLLAPGAALSLEALVRHPALAALPIGLLTAHAVGAFEPVQ